MRALRFNSFGDPSVLELAEVVAPAVSETTALVRVMAASINPSDVKHVAGAMKQTTLPRIPGRGFAGGGQEADAAAAHPRPRFRRGGRGGAARVARCGSLGDRRRRV